MILLKKIAVNSLLLGVLFTMLILPMGAMGLTSLQQNNVLSAEDVQTQYLPEQPETIKVPDGGEQVKFVQDDSTINDPMETTPETEPVEDNLETFDEITE